jgi:SAM-dependent methyltransferase
MKARAETERLFSLCPVPPAGKWVDLGCGEGETAKWLSRQGACAYGVDCAAPKEPFGGFFLLDMRSLPWESASFDGAVAECSLSVSGSPLDALREAARALRSGGSFLLSDAYAERECASLPTMEGWLQLLGQSGFFAEKLEDGTLEWRGRVSRALWEGKECLPSWKGAGRTGYFYLAARKGAIEAAGAPARSGGQ